MKTETKTKKFLLEEIERLRFENDNLKRANKKLLASQEMIDEFNSADENLKEIFKNGGNNDNFIFNDASKTKELFEKNPHPMWIFDTKTLAFLAVNDAALEKYGYSKKEFSCMTIKDIQKLLKSSSKPDQGIDCAGSWRHRRKNGEIIDVEIVSHTLKFMGKDAELVMVNDITERKRTHRALQLSEAKFKGLINSMQDLVYTLDLDMNIIGLYGMWSEMYGLSEELLLGKKITSFLSPAEAEINDIACSRAFNGESVKFEWSLRKDADKFFFESSLTPLFGSNSEIIGVVGVAREITERKNTELRIRESEERYRKLFDFSPEPIIVHRDSKVLFINSAGVELLGAQNQDEIIGREILDFIHPDFHSEVKERMEQLLKGIEKLGMVQEKFVKIDGSVIDVEASTISFRSEGEIAAQVVLRDITERKIAENKLKEKELLVRTVVTNAPVILWSTDINGVFTLSDGKALESLGLKPGEVVGKTVSEIYEDYPEIINATKRALGGESFLTSLSIGGLIFEARYSPLIDSNSNIFGTIGLAVEITDRKLAEIELKKLSQAVKQSPASIVITDLNGLIEYVNPKFTEVTGYTLKESIGKNSRILKSGNQSREFYNNMYETLLAGNEWHGEFQNKKKSGELYWESAFISPIKNEYGELTHFLAVKEDITNRKRDQEELIKSKQMAEEANKLKSSLLANMSHEFRTPLNGILGFSQLLRDEISDSDQLDMLEKIMQSGKRLMNTLNSVLTLTELEHNNYLISKSEIDLAICCKELRSLYIKQALNKNLEINLDLKSESLNVVTDENIFIKILSCIIENAIKYTHHGEIKIELTDCIESDGRKKAIVNIIDTGIGIRESDQKIIFDEFKQLSEGSRRDFEGLGLGLSLANKMVNLIGGSISVQSEIGKGSKFTLMLPIDTSDEVDVVPAGQILTEPELPVISKTQHESHSPHVLLVEDNPLNIEVVQKFLSKTCNVFAARNGIAAINLCKEHDYSLIMIDINLGQGMNGTEVLDEIKKLSKYENVPIIALTGYASESNKKEFLAQGFTHYLAKPFEKRELIKLIMNILKLN